MHLWARPDRETAFSMLIELISKSAKISNSLSNYQKWMKLKQTGTYRSTKHPYEALVDIARHASF
jgi:hypothetical protein